MYNLSKQRSVLTAEKQALFEARLKQKGLTIARIPRRKETDLCLLSYAQQRLWFLDQLEPGTSTYNIPTALRLCGTLNVQALEYSIQRVVERHEVLRTTFVLVEDRPVQIVGAGKEYGATLVDLSQLSQKQSEEAARNLAQQEATHPFDLADGPLLRTAIIRLRKDEHIFLLTVHHICFDGWARNIFIREVSAFYSAFTLNQSPSLPELPIQYADFALWQHQRLQGEELEDHLRYWTEHLARLAPLEFPTDYPHPTIQTSNGARQMLVLPALLCDNLKQLSQREGVTLFMTVLAAFQVLLSRYTGQTDITVGTDITNRARPELEGLIGFFVNTLVMRTDLSGNPSFQELLSRVREVAVGAYAHQELPFEKIVEALQRERDLSRSPLFQIMLSFPQASPTIEAPMFQELTLHSLEQEQITAKFDFSLTIVEIEQKLHCELEYNTDLFKRESISRLLKHWETLLVGIVAHPEWPLAQLPLWREEERQRILVEWNSATAAYPLESALPVVFQAQVLRTPDRIAVVDGDIELTYADLDRRANQLANYLRSLGVKPEVRTGLYMERSELMLIAILAIFKAGGAYVPLDPAYPQERLKFILADAQLPLILTTSRLYESLPDASIRIICLDTAWQLLTQYSADALSDWYRSDHLAYVIYTSGSTGSPKGVMVSQQGMLNHLFAKRDALALKEDERLAQTASHCFDISVWQFLAALITGGQVDLIHDDDAHDPYRLLRQVVTLGISVLELVPSLLRMLLDELELLDSGVEQVLSLRWLMVTGEAVSPQLCRRWLQHYTHIPLINAYGPTECSDDVTHAVIQQQPASDYANVPIGRPIPNMQIYLLDGNLSPVPVGVVGQIYVGGVGVGRGYLSDPARTAAVFLPDPYSKVKGGRFYHTGDLGRYLEDGQVEFLGRIDHQVKVRGYRIELGEIESVLEQHPLVHQGVVIDWGDQPGDKQLVAYIVAKVGSAVSTGELQAYLHTKLSSYMVPSLFVMLEALPLTPNGKVDRRALPAPHISTGEQTTDFVAPTTPLQITLADIWCTVLGVEQVSLHDNFFALGGHSLLATQVIARLRKAFQVELPLLSFFRSPTIAALAEVIEDLILDELEILSEEEAESLVAGEYPIALEVKE